MLQEFIAAIILVAIAVAAIAIKMFLKKGGQFEKKCGTQDPKTGKPIGACSCSGDGCDLKDLYTQQKEKPQRPV